MKRYHTAVALRKESVDRNCCIMPASCLSSVALRKESVDRNIVGQLEGLASVLSLSARRAWIEIHVAYSSYSLFAGRSPQGERG